MYYVFVMALATLFSFLSSSIVIKAQETFEHIEYRQATPDDALGILELINTQAIADSDKIVILPKLFRKESIEKSIEKSRLFVAVFNGKIIGFKKLFCISDKQELQVILAEELRCTTQAVDQGSIQEVAKRVYAFVHSMPDSCPEIIERATYIYDGGDYTHPNYRGRKINTRLTKRAFELLQATVANHIRENNSEQVIIAYGLTRANAGDNFVGGRTRSIVQCFLRFLRSLTGNNENSLSGRRYTAFMPTFDPEGQELRPLPDSRSIPGYGYLLAALLLQYGAQQGNNNGRSA